MTPQMTPQILKKDGRIQDWDISKVIAAANKSATSIGHKLSDKEVEALISIIIPTATLHGATDSEIEGKNILSVSKMHTLVVDALTHVNPNVAHSYQNFRAYKEEWSQSWNQINKNSDRILAIGDRENANFDSTMTSTKSSLMRGELTKEIYKRRFLSPEQLDVMETGYVYFHDLRDLIFNSINCCLFDMGKVLSGGFTMGNLTYSEPKSVLTAIQVIGDVMLNTTGQQFGGFTVPDIDKVLIPFVKKHRTYLKEKAIRLKIPDVDSFVASEITDELRQGFQSMEMKLNTVPSGRGDFAFTTLSFGNIDSTDNEVREIQNLICQTILSVREKGVGFQQPVTFPKLVFLFNNEQYNKDPSYKKLFELSALCSSKSMYPDYLSVDGKSYVGDMYRESGEVVSPMGCRAFLSPYYDETGKAIFTGRANIGAASLNLPMIWQKSNGKRFFKDLEHYMQMIREFHISRYEAIANNYCSSNPMAFTQGGLYGGTKDPEERIGFDIVKTFTASFGITALNELNVLMEGKKLHESDHSKVKAVLKFINQKIEQFKFEDGYLYALYGTPAESLCGTQVRQFKAKFGTIKDVSDRDYFSNSFHMHVTADISPFKKQDLEKDLFHMVTGGHIQYVRLPNTKNIEAIKAVIIRAMSFGLYFGVNFNLVICEDCGYRPENADYDVEECPKCKSRRIMMLNRLCGYLGYGKVDGISRFNDSKLAEVKERSSM